MSASRYCSLLFLAASIANGEPAPSLQLQTEVAVTAGLGGRPVGKWGGGSLVIVEPGGTSFLTISMLNKEGRPAGFQSVEIPGAAHVNVSGFARGQDGTTAFTGGFKKKSGETGSFVGWVAADGSPAILVYTSPFIPLAVTVAADGSIWAAGPSKNLDNKAFRRYSQGGELLGEFIDQAEFGDRSSLYSTRAVFGAMGDHVVWYSSKENELLELGPQGEVARLNNLKLPNDETEAGFAITAQGDLFVSSQGRDTWSVSKLDREFGQWNLLEQVPYGGSVRPTILYGAEGEQLVAWSDSRTFRFLSVTD